jgi:hypothetical protein
MTDDLDSKTHVPRHAPDDLQLLEILAAEYGDMRLNDIEKFRHHRGHSLEMAQAKRAAQRRAQVLDLDVSLMTLRVHLRHGRMKQNVDAGLFEQLPVAAKIARIGRKILPRRELRWVDEDRYDKAVAVLFSSPHQAQVAFMQKAHGWNKSDPPALTPLGVAPTLHLIYALND